jgi:quinol monooxygenase YgiN
MAGFLIALVATLGGLVSSGLIVMRTYNERRPHLVAWSVTVLGLTIALASMAIGFVSGFSAPMFRAMEIGGALLAPVWLAVGVIVLIARPVQVRFAAWLGAISFSIVAVVVLLLDRLKTGTFDKTLPTGKTYYDVVPSALLNTAHVVVVILLVVCAAVCARQVRDRNSEAYRNLMPIALVALAGVLIVMGSGGYLPGPLTPLVLGVAVGLVAYGGVRTAPYASEEDDEQDGYEEPHTGYEQGLPAHPPPREAPAMYSAATPMPAPPMPAPPMPAPPAPSATRTGPHAAGPSAPEMYGQITVFTLLEGREGAFDRLVHEAVRTARDAEPDLIIFACHEVVDAPTQRIFYQLFRDEAAFQDHQRQQYVLRFLGDSRSHVLATNVIEIKLKDAKVLPLPSLMGRG